MAPSAATAPVSTIATTSANTKTQKNFEQLRRLILGRNPSLDEIRRLVEMNPSCVQQRDPHHALLPLHWAIVFQNPLAIVQYLLEIFPAAISETDNDGRLPLHHACRQEGNVALVAYLLEQNPRLATQRDHRGKTPLHCACMEGVPSDIPRLLLQANMACAKIRTRDGQTALHMACDANAPSTTIQLLVDAYPEAVKYLTDANTGKFALAKEYLARKVKQTEEEADRHAAAAAAEQQRQLSAKPITKTSRYDPQPTLTNMTDHSTIDINASSESDQIRRRLDDEERQIQMEEQHLNIIAKQQQAAALLRLKEQELDVEQKAAELDRLIQQKEAHLESGRFQKETQRIYSEISSSAAKAKQQRHLNDSGIGRSRSFNGHFSTNVHDFIDTTDMAPLAQLPRHDLQPNNISRINLATPSVLSKRGVRIEHDNEHAFDEDEDDEDDAYFQSLRHTRKQNDGSIQDNTQPLYQESKLHSGESTSWVAPAEAYSSSSAKGRDPSTDTGSSYPELRPTLHEASLDDSNIRIMGILDPSPPPQQLHTITTTTTTQTPAIQEQLQQALQMLNHAEERRKGEIKDAQEQQAKLQDELAKLMQKLEGSEKNRAADVEIERKQQHEQAHHEAEAAREKQSQQDRAPAPLPQEPRLTKQPPGERQRPGMPPATSATNVVQGYTSGSADAPARISTTADGSFTEPSMGNPRVQQQHRRRQQLPALSMKDEASSESPQSSSNFLKDHRGRTPLHIALTNGPSYTVVQFLLQQFPLSIYQIDLEGNTPLHCACSFPSTPFEILQLLVDIFPAATLLANTQQQLPLHLACQYHGQRVEVLQLLLDVARSIERDLTHSEAEEEG
jgi:ankyrin repeat protein